MQKITSFPRCFYIYAKVGGPQISSVNQNSTNLQSQKIICYTSRICYFQTESLLWFVDLKLPQVLIYMLFLLTNNALIQIWDRVVQFLAEICGFSICGWIIQICGIASCRLAHQRNLGICDIGIIPRIYEFAICWQRWACSLLHISSCAFMHFLALQPGQQVDIYLESLF